MGDNPGDVGRRGVFLQCDWQIFWLVRRLFEAPEQPISVYTEPGADQVNLLFDALQILAADDHVVGRTAVGQRDSVAVQYSAPRRFERKPAQAVLQRHLRVIYGVDDLHPAQPRPEEQKNSQSD